MKLHSFHLNRKKAHFTFCEAKVVLLWTISLSRTTPSCAFGILSATPLVKQKQEQKAKGNAFWTSGTSVLLLLGAQALVSEPYVSL